MAKPRPKIVGQMEADGLTAVGTLMDISRVGFPDGNILVYT